MALGRFRRAWMRAVSGPDAVEEALLNVVAQQQAQIDWMSRRCAARDDTIRKLTKDRLAVEMLAATRVLEINRLNLALADMTAKWAKAAGIEYEVPESEVNKR